MQNIGISKVFQLIICVFVLLFQWAQLTLSSPGAVEPHLPDICILYKLLLEAGKFVNLYDWLVVRAPIVCLANKSLAFLIELQ